VGQGRQARAATHLAEVRPKLPRRQRPDHMTACAVCCLIDHVTDRSPSRKLRTQPFPPSSCSS
jgi:hypothetical protein